MSFVGSSSSSSAFASFASGVHFAPLLKPFCFIVCQVWVNVHGLEICMEMKLINVFMLILVESLVLPQNPRSKFSVAAAFEDTICFLNEFSLGAVLWTSFRMTLFQTSGLSKKSFQLLTYLFVHVLLP